MLCSDDYYGNFYWLVFFKLHIYYTHLHHGPEFDGPRNSGRDGKYVVCLMKIIECQDDVRLMTIIKCQDVYLFKDQRENPRDYPRQVEFYEIFKGMLG